MSGKLALVSTGTGVVDNIVSLVRSHAPHVDYFNIVDDGVIKAIAANENVVPPSVYDRITSYCRLAERAGADAVLVTCSSISEVVDVAARFVDIPVYKIDEPMAEAAVERAATSIGVAATLATTLGPTIRQVQSKINASGKALQIVEGLCDGAFEALLDGDSAAHDKTVLNRVRELLDACDVVVLAQASMARAVAALDNGKERVLTSPEMGVQRAVSQFKQ